MAETGSVIGSRYEILGLIGTGGMSHVYLAEDKKLKKQWAVKEIKMKTGTKANAAAFCSALTEMEMMRRLEHPFLPRIVDRIEEKGAIYVVMDYIEGEPLSKVIQERGACSAEQVIFWAKDLCLVIGYLHTREPQIIYCDMKPANIILQKNGRITLIDLGAARAYKKENSKTCICFGTKGYAAPEQCGGNGQMDVRTDIYALGATMYHLLTGESPLYRAYGKKRFRCRKTPAEKALERVIQKCMEEKQEKRYQSCEALFQALSRCEKKKKTTDRKTEVYRLFCGAAAVCCLLAAALFFKAERMEVQGTYCRTVLSGIRFAGADIKPDGIPEKWQEYLTYVIRYRGACKTALLCGLGMGGVRFIRKKRRMRF